MSYNEFTNVKITGVCGVVPDKVFFYEEELKEFPFTEKSSRKLGKTMGFKEHRITDFKTTHCDFASYLLDYSFKKNYIHKDKLQCIIVVSQCMDHLVPGNSKVIHGQLELSHNTHCIDIYENCIGYISGLQLACSFVSSNCYDEVVVITTDAGSCHASKLDRNSYPLQGDAAGLTVVKRSTNKTDTIQFEFEHDGTKKDALIVPAGGLRIPYSEETAKVVQDEMGNYRSLNACYMDGTAVFQFVMEEVPSFIDKICRHARVDKESIQYHLTHQPNKFMLERLADLMNVPRTRLFNNIAEYFGNSSSVTIPINIAYNLGKSLLEKEFFVCFSAFGAGLSLASALCNLGNLEFCDFIEHPGNGAFTYNDNL